MDNNEKNNDSLSEMNNLFGTNITPTNTLPNKENEETVKDIPNINNEVTSKVVEENKQVEEKIKEEFTPINEPVIEKKEEENIEEKKENPKEENTPINEPVTGEEHKFINEEYVNKDENKPLVESPSNENKEDGGLISELIYTVEHFDFKEVKVNIALIGFVISLVGAVLYNLIITIPGVALSYLAYKQSTEGKLSKQDKLLAVLGIALGVCCVASLLITKVSSLFY